MLCCLLEKFTMRHSNTFLTCILFSRVEKYDVSNSSLVRSCGSTAKRSLASSPADNLTCLTYWLVSPKQTSRCGSMWTTYGSKSRPSDRQSCSKASRAPSRRCTLRRSCTASVSVGMMSSCLRARMPRPRTRPARPWAAPRRSP